MAYAPPAATKTANTGSNLLVQLGNSKRSISLPLSYGVANVNRLESVSAAFDIIRIEDGKNRDDVSNCRNPLQTAFPGAKNRPHGQKTIPFARCDILSREGLAGSRDHSDQGRGYGARFFSFRCSVRRGMSKIRAACVMLPSQSVRTFWMWFHSDSARDGRWSCVRVVLSASNASMT